MAAKCPVHRWCWREPGHPGDCRDWYELEKFTLDIQIDDALFKVEWKCTYTRSSMEFTVRPAGGDYRTWVCGFVNDEGLNFKAWRSSDLAHWAAMTLDHFEALARAVEDPVFAGCVGEVVEYHQRLGGPSERRGHG